MIIFCSLSKHQKYTLKRNQLNIARTVMIMIVLHYNRYIYQTVTSIEKLYKYTNYKR